MAHVEHMRYAAYEGEWVASAILEDRAAKLGDRTFITRSDGSLTYAELAQAAARVAGALKRARRRSPATAWRRCSPAASST